MKKNDLMEIKKTDLKALLEKIKQTRKELTGLNLERKTGKVTNHKAFKNKRRDLAQMLTVLKQKQLLVELEKGEENA